MKINSEAVVVVDTIAVVVVVHFCAVLVAAAFDETLKIYENRYRRVYKPIEYELKEQFLSRNLLILRLFCFVSFTTKLTRSRFTEQFMSEI